VVEEQRPGEYMPIEEDERGTYLFNSRDMFMLPYLGQLTQAGICSFKIEGRMKSVHYLATVLNAYRTNLDAWWEQRDEYKTQDAWIQELARASHRPWSTGFYFGDLGAEAQYLETSKYHRPASFVAVVKGSEEGWLHLEQRGNFGRGETLEVVVPGELPMQVIVDELYDADGNSLERAPHAQQLLKLPWRGKALPQFTVLRRVDK
jgi:putative protease